VIKLCYVFVRCVCGVLLLFILPGCESSSTQRVSGMITLDGTPLETGEITFSSVSEGGGPDAGSIIENGRYQVPAVAQGLRAGDDYIVSIISMAGSGQWLPDPTAPTGKSEGLINVLPTRYNTESELVVTISSTQHKNTFDFELTSKP